MTTAQVVETSVTVNNDSPIQDYVHPDDQTQPAFEMNPGFKPFTRRILVRMTKRWPRPLDGGFCLVRDFFTIPFYNYELRTLITSWTCLIEGVR